MKTIASLSQTPRADFEAVLETRQLRVDALLQGALTAAPLLFSAVAIQVGQAARGEGGAAALVWVGKLGVLHLALAAALWLLSPLAEALLFREKALRKAAARRLPENPVHAPGPAGQCLALLRSARILRLAMYEAPALLGGLVLFLAAREGLLAAYPFLWVNAASAFALVARSLTSWPTRGRVLDEFDHWIAKKGP